MFFTGETFVFYGHKRESRVATHTEQAYIINDYALYSCPSSQQYLDFWYSKRSRSFLHQRKQLYDEKKTFKCCCTSCVPNLFMLARMFRYFLHACARNMHACVQNFQVNTHDTFVKYRTESLGQNSKIAFFDWMTLAFDL